MGWTGVALRDGLHETPGWQVWILVGRASDLVATGGANRPLAVDGASRAPHLHDIMVVMSWLCST